MQIPHKTSMLILGLKAVQKRLEHEKYAQPLLKKH